MARFATLYSGSSGNASVVEEDGKFLLIDMGASCKATCCALQMLGLDINNLQAILVTHEHSDHIKGLKVFLKKHPVQLFASLPTIDALWHMGAVPEETELVAVNNRLDNIAGFTIEGFSTSHDAAGSCGFRIKTPQNAQMAFATDLGVVTVDVFQKLQQASLVALEANYDTQMLRTGPYPAILKQRVASQRGHLSNEMSASTIAALVAEGCRSVTLCHLSEENNTPQLALRTVQGALADAGVTNPCNIQVAPRRHPGEWMEF